MKTIHYFLSLTLSCLAGNAQHKTMIIPIDDDPTPIYYEWLNTDSKILTKMKLNYKKPDGFKELTEGECFKKYPKFEQAFSCLSHQLQSDDNQFITFMPIYGFLTSEEAKKRGFPLDNIDAMHIGQLKYPIKVLIGEEAANNWKELVSYYPPI